MEIVIPDIPFYMVWELMQPTTTIVTVSFANAIDLAIPTYSAIDLAVEV